MAPAPAPALGLTMAPAPALGLTIAPAPALGLTMALAQAPALVSAPPLTSARHRPHRSLRVMSSESYRPHPLTRHRPQQVALPVAPAHTMDLARAPAPPTIQVCPQSFRCPLPTSSPPCRDRRPIHGRRSHTRQFPLLHRSRQGRARRPGVPVLHLVVDDAT